MRALPEYWRCVLFNTLTWPENPADAILEVLNSPGGHAPRPPLKEGASAR